MTIGPLMDVSSHSIEQLYDLYFAVAEQDHAFRLQALYGATAPPEGHCTFRPLSREAFTQRVLHYDAIEDGVPGRSLRQRLARQAAAYGVGDETQAAIRRVA